MKNRSISIALSFLLLVSSNMQCDAAQSKMPETGASIAQTGNQAYEKFVQWLQTKTASTQEDAQALWDYAAQKARGIQTTIAAHEKALTRAAKIGIPLAIILAAAAFIWKWQIDQLQREAEESPDYASIKALEARGALNRERAQRILSAAVDKNQDTIVSYLLSKENLLMQEDIDDVLPLVKDFMLAIRLLKFGKPSREKLKEAIIKVAITRNSEILAALITQWNADVSDITLRVLRRLDVFDHLPENQSIQNLQLLFDNSETISPPSLTRVLQNSLIRNKNKISRFLLNNDARPEISAVDTYFRFLRRPGLGRRPLLDFELIELLLQNGADPNFKWRFGRPRVDTALTFAVRYNNHALAEILLKYRANPDLPNALEELPINLAQDKKMRKLLLQYGATPTDDPLVQEAVRELRRLAPQEMRFREIGGIPAHQRRPGLGLGVRGRRRIARQQQSAPSHEDTGAGVGGAGAGKDE